MHQPDETLTVQIGGLQLTARARGGPRVLQLAASDGRPLFAETPDTSWSTPFGTFYLRGGHRLWHAPEAFPRSYVPDDDGPAAAFDGTTLTLTGAIEPVGISKSITISAVGPQRLRLRHTLTNHSSWPISCAPWAITQLRPGGTAIMPLRPSRQDGLLPDRTLRFWPYCSPGDARLHWHDDFVAVSGTLNGTPAKIGTLTSADWLAYLSEDQLFWKIGRPAEHLSFAHGCNLELYFDRTCTELETHGPLVTLAPQDSVSHDEIWGLNTVAPTTSFDTLHQCCLHEVAAHPQR